MSTVNRDKVSNKNINLLQKSGSKIRNRVNKNIENDHVC